MRFSEIVGQDALVRNLRGAFAQGKAANAYLITGPAGTGKRSLADICARALLCKGAEKPCDVCGPCQRVLSGNHPDLIRVRPEKSIGVDDVRALGDALSVKPYEGGRHVAIVENAEKMTQQAQNALLKTLEEPPDGVVFLLLADRPEAMLPTVRSRSRLMRMRPLSPRDEEALLVSRGVERERAKLLARLSQGSAGLALELNESESYWLLRGRVISALTGLRARADVGTMAYKLKDDKDDAQRALDVMEMWARDRMAIQEAGAPAFAIDEEARLNAWAHDGVNMLTRVFEARRRLASNVAWLSVVEALFFEIVGGNDTWQR